MFLSHVSMCGNSKKINFESYHRVKLHTLSMGVKQNKAVTLSHCDSRVHCYALLCDGQKALCWKLILLVAAIKTVDALSLLLVKNSNMST